MNTRSRRLPNGGSYRDRSSSRERPRTRTYDEHSESYESDYSDDFEPDTRSRDETPPRRRRARSPKRKTDQYSSDQSATSHLHSIGSKKSTGRRTYSKKPRPRQGWGSRNTSKSDQIRPRPDTITSRLLSARQRRINEIQNELAETEHRLESVLKENKLLKTVQHRQDKALRRFQDVESDLPRLISQNFEDQKVLKTRLKKAQEAERILEDKLRDNNDEMQKMERTLRKLKKVVYDKNLGERSELARQLTNTENNLTVAERQIKELEKKLELTSSSFTRQIRSERQKHKETKQKLDALIEDYQSVTAKLKEKERALGVSNIYALRSKEGSFVKSPRKAADVTTSATQTDGVLAISSIELKRTGSPVAVKFEGSSYRQRMHIEEKSVKPDRTVESTREGSSTAAPEKHGPPEESSSVMMNGLHSVTNHAQSPREKDTLFLTTKFQSNSPSPNNSLVKDSIDFGKVEKAPEQGLGVISPLRSNLQTLEKSDPFAEAERQRKQEEEAAKLAESKKKKAALLAKMKELEDSDSVALPLSPVLGPIQVTDPLPPVVSGGSKSNSFVSNPKSKADLVKSLLGTDTDPVVENLHLGLPSNAKKTPEKPEKEMSFGSYAPSVGTSQASRKPRAPQNPQKKSVGSDSNDDEPLFDINSGKPANKSSDILFQLFGDQPKNDQDSNANVSKMGESVTPRAKPVHSAYPWERNVVTSTQLNGTVNHAPNKIKTGLAVKASAPIQEDDIEELAL